MARTSFRAIFGRVVPGSVVVVAALFGVRTLSSAPVELTEIRSVDLLSKASLARSPWKTWYGDAVVATTESRISVVRRSSKDLAAYIMVQSPTILPGHRYVVSGQASGKRGKFTYGTIAFYSATSDPLNKSLLQERWTSETQSIWSTKPIVAPANAKYLLFGITRNSVKEFVIERLRLRDVTSQAELARLPKTSPVPTAVKVAPPSPATTTTTTLPVLADLPSRTTLLLAKRTSKTPKYEWSTWYGDATVTARKDDVTVSVAPGTPKDAAAATILSVPTFRGGHKYQLRGQLSWDSVTTGSAVSSTSAPVVSDADRQKKSFGLIRFLDEQAKPIGSDVNLPIQIDASEAKIAWQGAFPPRTQYAVLGVASAGSFRVSNLDLADVSDDELVSSMAAKSATAVVSPSTTVPVVPIVLSKNRVRSEVSLLERGAGVFGWKPWFGKSVVSVRSGVLTVSRGGGDKAGSAAVSVGGPVVVAGHRYRLVAEFDSSVGALGLVRSGATAVLFYDVKSRKLGEAGVLRPVGGSGSVLAWEGVAPEGAAYLLFGAYRTDAATWAVRGLSLADISSEKEFPSTVPSSVVPSTVVSPSTTVPVVPIVLSKNRVRSEVSLLERGAGVFGWKPWFGKSVVSVRSGVLTVSRGGGDKAGSAAVSVGGPVVVAGHRYRLVAEFDSSVGALGLVRSGATAVLFYDVKSRKLGEAGVLRPVGGSGSVLAWEGVAPEGAAYLLFGAYRTDAATWAVRGLSLADISSEKEFPSTVPSTTAAGRPTPTTATTVPSSTVASRSGLDDENAVALPPLPATTVPFTAASQSVLIPDEGWKVWFGDPVVTANPGAIDVSRSTGGPFGVFASVDAAALEPGVSYRLKLRVERDEEVSVGGYIQIYAKDGSDLGERIPIVKVPGSTDENAIFTLPVGAQSFVVGVVQNGGDRFKILNNLLQRSV